MNPMLMCDFYKLSHREQYPKGTELVYSTWTARTSRLLGVNEVVFFGLQYFIKEYLLAYFNITFFLKPIDKILDEYRNVIRGCLGVENPQTQHIEELHALGYLPLKISSVDEGGVYPIGMPLMTIHNTLPQFYWLTNFMESLMSCELWQPTTSATIAYQFAKLLTHYNNKTDLGKPVMMHDFSMRGMAGNFSAMTSGMGHLLVSQFTDNIPAILGAHQYYDMPYNFGGSIPATEHSVQCAYDDDEGYLHHLLNIYPQGPVSIVCDGYDFWHFIDTILPMFNHQILTRDGKVVIRPDSGDPVKILCGDDSLDGIAKLGAVQALWDIFDGTINEQGYKVLDSHIGLIYGDAITFDRCKEICERLEKAGFASTNVMFGIGSYTYQYNTRDTLGFALKSTLCVINGEEKFIYKDPKTDDGTKKSQRGAVRVWNDEGWKWEDCLPLNHGLETALITRYDNGLIKNTINFDRMRDRLLTLGVAQ